MKVWAATFVVALAIISIPADAASASREISLETGVTAVVDSGPLRVVVTPHPGDAWSRLARRLTGDASNWSEIAAHNSMGENLIAGSSVVVPWELVRPDLRVRAIRALFPESGRSREGWVHEVVLDRGEEGESLWEIAEWLTLDGTNYRALMAASSGRPLSTRPGERVLIPATLLLPELRDLPPERNTAPARARAADRPMQIASSGEELLEYEVDEPTPYAVYDLEEGEAIYSAVAVRFTGRVHADDVNDAVSRIIEFNAIEDVSRLPVGYPVRIPLDMLTDQFRPRGDARREAWELAQASLGSGQRLRALRLEGVHVIIDPGHGGRDVGASSGDIWESNYVYDIAKKLRDQLERETGATVWMTTHSARSERVRQDRITGIADHVLNTDPRYDLASPTVGVNLRWYLANSILSRLTASGVPRERVIFISIHADSLHPSLRGAMAYIPGHRYVQGSFGKREQVYLARREVRENPVSTLTFDDARIGEALSHDLAREILDAMRARDLAVHPFTSIRDHVVRKGREWVPAVIRHNQVYSRVLLEVCNLSNPSDRERLESDAWRSEVAKAILDGINQYFSSSGTGATASAVAAR